MDTISIKSTIQTATNNFQAEDETDYSAITYFVDSKSVLKLVGPSVTIYNNTNFGAPDFDYPGTLEKDITIPLVSSAIPQGTYTLTTTTRVTKECPIISINLGSNYILVDLALEDNFTGGQTIELAGGPNAGTYTIATISSNGFGTILTLVEPLSSSTATDLVTFDEEVVTSTIYTYCYTAPAPVLILTPVCATATLEVSQTTNYAITCEGQTIQPSTNSPVVTLNAPLNAGGSPVYPQTVSGSLPFSTTELWTQTWTATMVTTLVYELPSGLFIETSVTSTVSVDVSCDDSLCCMSTCLQNASNAFTAVAATGNLNEIVLALRTYTQVIGAFMMYSVGVKCGDETTINNAVAKMKALLADTACCNNCDDTGQSVQIVALYNVIVSGGTVVVEAPDVYLDLSTAVVGSTTTYSLTLNTTQVENLISTYLAANPSIITNIVNDMVLVTSVYSNDSTTYDTPISWSGDVSIGSDLITNVSMTGGLITDIKIGDPISSSFFPTYNPYVIAINPGGTIQVSENSTSTQVGTAIQIRSEYQGIQANKYKRTVAGVDSYYYQFNCIFAKSVEADATTYAIQLVNDEASPGASQVYGTNSGGTKGWMYAPMVSSLVENVGGAAAPGTTNYAITTITASTAGTYNIYISCQVDCGATPPTSYDISIRNNGALINPSAQYNSGANKPAFDTQSISLITQKALIDTDSIILRIVVVGQIVTVSNISVVLIRVA